MEKSVVLLSAGLDSTVNFLLARKRGSVVLALTFDYGQKAAAREVACSRALCEKYDVPHLVVDLAFFKKFTQTSLINPDQTIPQSHEVDIHSVEHSLKTADRVWVPNRNGIFLNIAAGFAEGLGARYIVPGFNAEEAATFPDNSLAFQDRVDAALEYSTQNKVRVRCETVSMNKPEILRQGLEEGLDVKGLWPCYHGGENWCGECESCLRFKNAAQIVGLNS